MITALVAFPLAYAVFTIAGPKQKSLATTSAEHAGHDAELKPGSASLAFIPKQLTMPDVNPRDALLDPTGAVFHASLMLVTLAVLIGTTFVPNEAVEVWMVTAPAGVVAFGYDVATEYYRGKKARPASEDPKSDVKDTPSSDLKAEPVVPRAFVVERWSLPGVGRAVQGRFPTTCNTVSHLPVCMQPIVGWRAFVLTFRFESIAAAAAALRWGHLCARPSADIAGLDEHLRVLARAHRYKSGQSRVLSWM